MSNKKIGEVLIDKGLITTDQLEMALKAQLIYGGHLGTCLIEMGLIDEDALGKTLSEVCGVPYAPASALREIPDWTIKAFPRKVAEEYQAIPLKLVNKLMHVAMVDPRNLEAIDEMSFASGHRIYPWVSPELRIFQALESYYDVPRRLRYLTICRALDDKDEKAENVKGTSGAETLRKRKTRAAENDHGGGSTTGSPGGKAKSGGKAGGSHGDQGAEFGYGRSWREIADELEQAPAVPPGATGDGDKTASAASSVSADPARDHPLHGLEEIARRMCLAETKRELVDIIMSYTSTKMETCVLLAVNGDLASVLACGGGAMAGKRAPKVSFSVTKEAIFGLLEGEDFFRGAPALSDRFLNFYKSLGLPFPDDVFLAPVRPNDRLVAIFYGDGGAKGRIAGETEEYHRLFRIFELSLNLMLAKQKILDAARCAADRREHAVAGSPQDR